MALIGNGSVYRANPMHGQVADVRTLTPGNWYSPGARKRFAAGQAAISGVTNRAAVPEGYVPPYCREPAQKSGGLVSRGRIAGTGEVTAANLAGGLNALADLVGEGEITNAALALIVSAVAAITGTGSVSASIAGKLEAAAALGGSAAVTAALGAIAGLVSGVTGAGTVSAAGAVAKGTLSADIVVTGDLLNTANVGAAEFAALAETGYSYGDLLRILAAVAAGKTSIVDLGGGNATVTFRDLNDSKDRVVADMVGSERDAVTRDGT